MSRSMNNGKRYWRHYKTSPHRYNNNKQYGLRYFAFYSKADTIRKSSKHGFRGVFKMTAATEDKRED